MRSDGYTKYSGDGLADEQAVASFQICNVLSPSNVALIYVSTASEGTDPASEKEGAGNSSSRGAHVVSPWEQRHRIHESKMG